MDTGMYRLVHRDGLSRSLAESWVRVLRWLGRALLDVCRWHGVGIRYRVSGFSSADDPRRTESFPDLVAQSLDGIDLGLHDAYRRTELDGRPMANRARVYSVVSTTRLSLLRRLSDAPVHCREEEQSRRY